LIAIIPQPRIISPPDLNFGPSMGKLNGLELGMQATYFHHNFRIRRRTIAEEKSAHLFSRFFARLSEILRSEGNPLFCSRHEELAWNCVIRFDDTKDIILSVHNRSQNTPFQVWPSLAQWADGLPDIEKIRPILFSPEGRKYHSVGKFIGKSFSIGREFIVKP
jgi:hypothetical protein